MSLSVVVQGQFYHWTEDYLQRFCQYSDVSEVIFSTWIGESSKLTRSHPKLQILESAAPRQPGLGNRNYQIISSKNGLYKAKSKYAIKIRSDFFVSEFEMMNAFFYAHHQPKQIYAMSAYPRFPFHPRDHVFMGLTEDLQEAFNIPLDQLFKEYKEREDVRTETYIGMWYYQQFHSDVKKMIEKSKDYLTDSSPFKKEALAIYHDCLRSRKGFLPFPKLQVEWPKHYPQGYPFDYLQRLYGEVYHGEKF